MEFPKGLEKRQCRDGGDGEEISYLWQFQGTGARHSKAKSTRTNCLGVLNYKNPPKPEEHPL